MLISMLLPRAPSGWLTFSSKIRCYKNTHHISMSWIVLISHNTYIYLYVYMAFWPKIFSRNSFIHQYFCIIIILFFLVLGLYSNIGILAVTCPGFPGYCSESFPGMTCVVVCSRGRPNVPLCQVRIMTFFSWNWYLCLEKNSNDGHRLSDHSRLR